MGGDAAQMLVVADHGHDVALQFTEALAQQEVVEAVGHLGAEHGHPGTLVAEGQLGGQLMALGQDPDGRLNAIPIQAEPAQVENEAHEEGPRIRLRMLVEVDDVAAIAEHEVRQGGNEARTVLTADEEGGVGHGRIARGLPMVVPMRAVRMPNSPVPTTGMDPAGLMGVFRGIQLRQPA